MKKLLEVLRLCYENNLSNRDIALVSNLSHTTVNNYLGMFKHSGLPWPLDPMYEDEELLSKRLKENYVSPKPNSRIDFVAVHKELTMHKHMTLQLLFDEYKKEDKIDMSYSNLALLYRKWLKKQPNCMRQTHKAAERTSVDYSGDKVLVIDPETGEGKEAEIFVGVLGTSGYMYVEATWSQALPDWVMSHVRMFEYFQGCSQLVICDNLLSGVFKPDRYDPDITPAYYNMLAYYGVACMPARVKKPKDKPDAENGVLIVQRWLLASLRHFKLYSLEELNAKLRELLEFANNKRFKQFPTSRKELYEELDKPLLRPLPNSRYIYRDHKKIRVAKDYHIALEGHYYSVPYTLISEEVDVWYNKTTVECYYKSKCVAKHIRATDTRNGQTTDRQHMPIKHRAYADLTPDSVLAEALQIGPSTAAMVEKILKAAPHSEIGCKRSCGFLKLGKRYSKKQLEAACSEGLSKNISNYKNIETIIKQQISTMPGAEDKSIQTHENIRGSEFYQKQI